MIFLSGVCHSHPEGAVFVADIHSFELWPGWSIDEEIGHGSFGRVYKAHMIQADGTAVYAAVKHIPIPTKTSEDDLLIDTPETRRRLERQLNMLQR